MSKEGTPELIQSWVVVDPEEKSETSGVQEVADNGDKEPDKDSDTDSISVISESGCSYKTDEEETLPETPGETPKEEPVVAAETEVVESVQEAVVPKKKVEVTIYYMVSTACALVVVGLSVGAQLYLQGASDVDNFEADYKFSPVQNLRNEEIPAKHKKKFKLDEVDGKIAKLEDNDFQIPGENDLRNLKSKYKPYKNKNVDVKANKENDDVREKFGKTHDNFDDKQDTSVKKKIKELKLKEDYLREKEKFLIEKEHDLLKKEHQLNKEKQNLGKKHDKKQQKNDKNHDDTHNEEFKEKREKSKQKDKKNLDKKEKETQRRFRFYEEQGRKKNVSGDWYLNLHEARDHFRQKKRSNFKRNKAYWYFQWMVDRARLRVK